MWKEALLDYASKLQGEASSDASLMSQVPSELATYSVKSFRINKETIFALRDCYVDHLHAQSTADAGDRLFKLNALWLEQQSFKLEQERLLTVLAAARLAEDYVEKLVLEPLRLAEQMAAEIVRLTKEVFDALKEGYDSGSVPGSIVTKAGLELDEARMGETRSKIDLLQRQIEMEAQQRRIRAETDDLDRRMALQKQIEELHTYVARTTYDVEFHTYEGAFLEEGDPIVTLVRRPL